MTTYLRFEGINGSITTKGFDGCAEIETCLFPGISSSVSNTSGYLHDRVHSKPRFQQFIITKVVDKSSCELMQRSFSHQVIPTVTVMFMTTGKTPQKYMEHKLSDVLVSHYSQMKLAEDDHPREEIWLSFSDIITSFTPYDSKNRAGSPIRTGYNIATGEAK